jgi:hypothetical protein
MSWATGYKEDATNNIHFKFPALMSDGRSTNWNPSCERNEVLIAQAGVKTNTDYRRYLQNNATSIMHKNWREVVDRYPYTVERSPLTSSSSQQFVREGKNVPYGYVSSDLRNEYLSREELNEKTTLPIMSQQTYFQYRETQRK